MEKETSMFFCSVRTLIAIYFLSGCFSPKVFAATECNLIQESIDKLGREMSIQRTIISSNPNPEIAAKANSVFKIKKYEYNLAQKEFKKAKCSDYRDKE